MHKSTLFASIVLAAAAAMPRAARADAWSSRVTDAATACRSGASSLRSLAADCRAHATPPPEGGSYCTGITWTESSADGATHEYTLSPDEAESVADRFDGYAPTLDTAATDIATLEDAAGKTQDKIRELGFEKSSADYQAWLSLAESSRDELAKETRKFLIARAFDGGEKLADGIAKLSRGKAERMAELLAHYGDAGASLGKELKRIARITGRRARAEAAAAAIEGLHALYDQATADDDLDALASALTGAVEIEGFGFLVDELKWTTAATFAYAANAVAEDQIDRLADMQVLQLRALKSLTELLERQVGRIDASVSELHPCSYAPPIV